MDGNRTPEELIRRYVNGECTDAEKALVESWHMDELTKSEHVTSQKKIAAVHRRMRKAVRSQSGISVRKLWPRVAVAATVILAVGMGSLFFIHNDHSEQIVARQPAKEKIVPGSNKAMLTLANGRRIS
ncbi:MAG: iron dicitrate transport regulator FecR, partial [Mucilaginibacter sp.]